ncbi:MAG: amino acid adenylation domain-containing protein, partial [Candidatus Obscuribacterales bacterium]|nr:amino acid adenylation domain-containing protein [Steroidobacteraceae bacterium]
NSLQGLQIELVDGFHQEGEYELVLEVVEQEASFALHFKYDANLFEARTIARLASHYANILTQVIERPHQPLGSYALITIQEQQQILHDWNAAMVKQPPGRCIHTLFEEQVERAPDAIAVTCDGQQLTYAQLNSKANQLARYLHSRGVAADELVAICVERGFEMMVGLLGILKAGGAYVPLDPSYPRERLAYMLKDSTPQWLLTQARLIPMLPVTSAHVIALDGDWSEIAKQENTNLDPIEIRLSAKNLAYVIYTSGSSGQPKGVMVEHANVVRLFTATKEWFHFDHRDVWTLFHSFAFDFSVWEIFGALLHGGRLVVVPYGITRSTQEFYRLVCQESVTILNQTPSAFREFMAVEAQSEQAHALRTVIFGGEALEVRMLKPWFVHNPGDQTQLINMYGITETTVHVSYRPLVLEDTGVYAGGSPIGKHIPDLQIYLLDNYRQLVPVGVAGEIYVSGAGVARGYLNRPELTATRFLQDPFSKDATARMYKTGDLGQWRADGDIEYLGRNDTQVKIRGFRIELGEIEAQLNLHQGVREAVVIAREDVPGEKRLVAYIVYSEGAMSVDVLRSYLKNILPEYMIPSAYVQLEQLPLTLNGKLDRKALPVPDSGALAMQKYEAPQGEIEIALAAIWQELLHVEHAGPPINALTNKDVGNAGVVRSIHRPDQIGIPYIPVGRPINVPDQIGIPYIPVGRHDNFFALGGHSLLIMQMIERLRLIGIAAEVQNIFTAPTLLALASTLSLENQPKVVVPPNLIPVGCEAITPAMLTLIDLKKEEINRIVQGVPGGAGDIQDIYPLAPLQEGILFHYLLSEAGDAYLMQTLLAFESRERLTEFVLALQTVIARHDILRTAVLWEGLSEPVQVVWRNAVLVVEEVKLEAGAGEAEVQLRDRFSARHYRLDVRHAPMIKGFLAPDERNGRWLLMLLNHHLVDDATTLQLVFHEVQALLMREEQQLPVPIPFRNFVAQARQGISQEEHEIFFREMLGDIEEPTTPFGLLEAQGQGMAIVEARRTVDPELVRRIRAAARALGVSAASICHLAYAMVLARICGREDVIFGTVLFGRMQGGSGSDRALGMFINTLPIRIKIGEAGASASACQTHALLAQLLRHEHASLVLAQRCSRVRAPTPLFSALLNYRHSAASAEQAAAAWNGIELLLSEERTNYPLVLSIDDLGEGFTLTVQVSDVLDPQRMCDFMCTSLSKLAEALENNPDLAIYKLDVLPVAECEQVLRKWNATKVEYPQDKLIHELFENQVDRTPDAIAVIYEDQQLTYQELNARANQLAHYLRQQGVGPDQLVAICVERSVAMVVGLLGILKAGGAYVPLDSSYPSERLAYMLEDAAPKILLTQASLKANVPHTSVAAKVLDIECREIAQQRSGNLDFVTGGVMSHHLAYVIYTSGSTGQPKGIMVEHRNVLNLWNAMEAGIFQWHPRCQRVSMNAPIAFDASVQQWVQLLTGRTLVIIPQALRLEGEAFSRYVTHHRIDGIDCTPSQLATLLSVGELENSKHVPVVMVVGGEAIDVSLWHRLQNLPEVACYNVYGPTECTVDVTLARVKDLSQAPHIGRPVSNTQAYILDSHHRPAPIGVIGELYIGGASVGRGYLNRPELTKERFLPDPFSKNIHARMYKTGDLGRWRADGNIEYLGRNDSQVKIRGFRIELGEIESQLRRHEHVKEATVIAREDMPGDKRLVAYITCTDATSSVEVLRTYLRTRLPEYMVPSAFVRLDALPLTPNGKLDRKSLPAPDSNALTIRQYEAPQGEIESTLATIWQTLLRVERVGRFDNFFELGGHSLLALTLRSRIQGLGFTVPLIALFQNPTIKMLAAYVLCAFTEKSVDLGPLAIRVNGDRRPLFILHGITGEVLPYFPLARLIDEGVPVYGLQLNSPLLSMQGLAAQHIKAIRQVQAHGPYRLVGHSFGGQLAYEIAAQLLAEEECVEFLGLIDSYNQPESAQARSARISQVLVLVLMIEGIFPTLAPKQLEEFKNMPDAGALLEHCQQAGLLPWDLDLSQVQRWTDTCSAAFEAAARYFPPPLGIPVHLFIADELSGSDQSRGWGTLLKSNLHVEFIGGTHISIIHSPQVQPLAAAITRTLNKIEQGSAATIKDYEVEEL